MGELVQEFAVFTEELRREREAQSREADELRTMKHGLLLQLQFVLPDAAEYLATTADSDHGSPSASRHGKIDKWRLGTPADSLAPAGLHSWGDGGWDKSGRGAASMASGKLPQSM